MKEAVNHPSHYGGEDNPYEVIKVMRAWLSADEYRGALKFNVHKYLARAGKKDNAKRAEDAAKAAWYSARLAEFEAELIEQERQEFRRAE